MKPRRFVFATSFFVLAASASAGVPDAIERISAGFLGRPYALGRLGEGTDGRYDRDPLFRTDVFDCQTYVETVLALAFARAPADVPRTMDALRYLGGHVSYFTRHHFPEADWIPGNVREGFVEDVTRGIAPAETRESRALIDKPGWVRALGVGAIQIDGIAAEEKERLLRRLKREGSAIEAAPVVVPYVPTAVAMEAETQRRIPSGAILSVVREGWFPAGEGTGMAISHMGFAIRERGTLFYRNASSARGAVVDVPLTDYLRPYLGSKTVRGIHVLVAKEGAR